MAPRSRRVALKASHHNDNAGSQSHMPMIMGYVFLFLVFIGAVSSVYFWESKSTQQAQYYTPSVMGRVESGESAGVNPPRAIPTPNGQYCIIDSVTGQPRVPFPTPVNYNGECE